MDFWTRYAPLAAEAVASGRLPQNAPSTCIECGHHGTDVIFGSCGACFDSWRAQ